jgi:hypothetical protein
MGKMIKKKKLKNRLSQWKEIAAYLECDVRTCQRWAAKKGLPIYKPTDGRVYAYKGELDAWIEKRESRKSTKRQSNIRSRIAPAALAIIPVSVILLVTLMWTARSARIPEDFLIKGSILVVLDGDGEEVWSYDTVNDTLRSTAYYKKRSQQKRLDHIHYDFPIIAFHDLDRNGGIETLFSIQTQDESQEGKLICLDEKGKEIWNFDGGKELKIGGKVYFKDYRIKGFDVFDLDKDGSKEIMVFSVHDPDYPCQLAILDQCGNIKMEYWNFGYIMDYRFIDLDMDGKDELLLTGTNDEYKKACLVVFDPENISGSSPQVDQEYYCEELGMGSHLEYILLPRTDYDMQKAVAECALQIKNLSAKSFSVKTQTSLIDFKFSYDLTIYDIVLGDDFEQAHKEAKAQGLIDSIVDEDYKQDLKEKILYWNEVGWGTKPKLTLF